jgi:hypothetical protein
LILNFVTAIAILNRLEQFDTMRGISNVYKIDGALSSESFAVLPKDQTDLRFLVVVLYSLASSTVFVVVAAESPFENGVKLLRHSSKL